ncbi:dihydroxyacetone kinase phosphoryl donor subunit DhaM [Luteimicrobium subarcticum]|uniref:Phosphocarrier protein HPr n=1 Tax=Luteimicrobium subarcticum TaxID=620910 RepID=A0A2M8WU36_9MICO|nr:dihydroxyacetone kinase phosphoryl donor subunit DhaM [Luteimicrobium subarcticum]PJI94450.1 PTS hybrid protein [Luteimicrobium subarcticum]
MPSEPSGRDDDRDDRRVGLVLVSHSAPLAAGARDLAAQMAPDVRVEVAGGRPDGGIGTDFDRVQAAVEGVLAACRGAVLLADLGSAVLTVDSVLELLDDDHRARARLADAPFVEGAVAAAVAAQGGGDVDAVLAAAQGAGASFAGGAASAAEQGPVSGTTDADAVVLRRTVTLRNPLGLHARPAATLARLAAGFDAAVTVAGVDAASVLELMGLGATGGQELEVTASGPDATAALAAVADEIASGFGEA